MKARMNEESNPQVEKFQIRDPEDTMPFSRGRPLSVPQILSRASGNADTAANQLRRNLDRFGSDANEAEMIAGIFRELQLRLDRMAGRVVRTGDA